MEALFEAGDDVRKFTPCGEKTAPGEIVRMAWNPKMDLVAIATKSGRVHLHRLTWEHVWSISYEESSEITCTAWRQDGKMLLVGYANGCGRLHHVEAGLLVQELMCASHIVHCDWTIPKSSAEFASPSSVERSSFNKRLTAEAVLGALPSFAKPAKLPAKYSNINWNAAVTKQADPDFNLDLLALTLDGGTVEVYTCDFLLLATITPPSATSHIVRAAFNAQSHSLLEIIEDDSLQTRSAASVDMTLLFENLPTLRDVCALTLAVRSLIQYLEATIDAMRALWSSLLKPLDDKFAKFMQEMPMLDIQREMLVLLMTERTSWPEVQGFFVREFSDHVLLKIWTNFDKNFATLLQLANINIMHALRTLHVQLAQAKHAFAAAAHWPSRMQSAGPFSPANAPCQDELAAADREQGKTATDAIARLQRIAGTFQIKAQELVADLHATHTGFHEFVNWLKYHYTKLDDDSDEAALATVDFKPAKVADFIHKHLRSLSAEKSTNIDIIHAYFEKDVAMSASKEKLLVGQELAAFSRELSMSGRSASEAAILRTLQGEQPLLLATLREKIQRNDTTKSGQSVTRAEDSELFDAFALESALILLEEEGVVEAVAAVPATGTSDSQDGDSNSAVMYRIKQMSTASPDEGSSSEGVSDGLLAPYDPELSLATLVRDMWAHISAMSSSIPASYISAPPSTTQPIGDNSGFIDVTQGETGHMVMLRKGESVLVVETRGEHSSASTSDSGVRVLKVQFPAGTMIYECFLYSSDAVLALVSQAHEGAGGERYLVKVEFGDVDSEAWHVYPSDECSEDMLFSSTPACEGVTLLHRKLELCGADPSLAAGCERDLASVYDKSGKVLLFDMRQHEDEDEDDEDEDEDDEDEEEDDEEGEDHEEGEEDDEADDDDDGDDDGDDGGDDDEEEKPVGVFEVMV